jgi:hypothetical protein
VCDAHHVAAQPQREQQLGGVGNEADYAHAGDSTRTWAAG